MESLRGAGETSSGDGRQRHSLINAAGDRFTFETGYPPMDSTEPSVKDRYRVGQPLPSGADQWLRLPLSRPTAILYGSNTRLPTQMKGIAVRSILVGGVILALAAFASQSVAQSSGTANTTPQYRESKPKNNPQIAAEFVAKNAARRQAAKEAAMRLGSMPNCMELDFQHRCVLMPEAAGYSGSL